MVVIYDGEKIVGFAMYTLFLEERENANKNDVLNKVKEMLNNEGINKSTIEVL